MSDAVDDPLRSRHGLNLGLIFGDSLSVPVHRWQLSILCSFNHLVELRSAAGLSFGPGHVHSLAHGSVQELSTVFRAPIEVQSPTVLHTVLQRRLTTAFNCIIGSRSIGRFRYISDVFAASHQRGGAGAPRKRHDKLVVDARAAGDLHRRVPALFGESQSLAHAHDVILGGHHGKLMLLLSCSRCVGGGAIFEFGRTNLD